MIARAYLCNSISATERAMDFHIYSRSSLDAAIVAIHTGWYVGSTQESET